MANDAKDVPECNRMRDTPESELTDEIMCSCWEAMGAQYRAENFDCLVPEQPDTTYTLMDLYNMCPQPRNNNSIKDMAVPSVVSASNLPFDIFV